MDFSTPTWTTYANRKSHRSRRPKDSTISPYDPAFDQALTDAHIYSNDYVYPNTIIGPAPENLDDIQRRLAQRRDSVSTDTFTNDHFINFIAVNHKVKTEIEAISSVFPKIRGSEDDLTFASGQNILFNHLHPLAPDIADAKPDYFTGANIDQIQQRVRAELGKYIIPSNNNSRPAAPNFFTEIKGPDGNLEKCNRQLVQDLSTGARAMHTLQIYGHESFYDGKAYTFGATFMSTNAQLSLYAMHPSAPMDGNAEDGNAMDGNVKDGNVKDGNVKDGNAKDGKPQYHTTCLAYYRLTMNAKTCREGIAAWRNLRDMAREKRNELIVW
jgi:hypothetical protein